LDPIPLVRVSAFVPFLNAFRQIGTPVERRLEQARVPVDFLNDPESLLPLTHLLSFLDRNAQAEGIQDLGLRAASQLHVSGLGLFGKILLQSASAHIALEKACKLIPLYNSGQRIWLEPWRGWTRICHRLPKESGAGRKFGNQFTMLMIVDLLRQAIGPDWRPAEIHYERGVDEPFIYEGSAERLRESEAAAVVVDPLSLTQPMRLSEAQFAGPDDPSRLATNAPAENFVASVRQVIQLYLRNDMVGIAKVSAMIGFRPRTLQRRLADCGVEFSELVAEARLGLARQLLADQAIAVTDIAQELGYSDAANFTRAFRQWTGVAPSFYRAGLSEQN